AAVLVEEHVLGILRAQAHARRLRMLARDPMHLVEEDAPEALPCMRATNAEHIEMELRPGNAQPLPDLDQAFHALLGILAELEPERVVAGVKFGGRRPGITGGREGRHAEHRASALD